MISNYLGTPPSYVINLIPPYKDFTAYMVNADKCIIYIGEKDSNGDLEAERQITVERSGIGWSITSDANEASVVDDVSYPYYAYSTVQYGTQLPTAYHTMRTSYMINFVAILIVGICLYKCFTKVLRG